MTRTRYSSVELRLGIGTRLGLRVDGSGTKEGMWIACIVVILIR